ncbi:hypothetical protein BOTBODRAFT_143426 [Botryobasidium botryosum FD-172 SS1]|uniref:D-xylose 1-dehydrogenase (NADP(+), D-xylono-1,5-lactone-forming) n=1 Tax=Botryobasidium botryosum (strain FD-172 SS1) TaxID=930990 RepID=A0A067MUN5_BOTB1|nr:hypothetical protein BOTBODRAFT_143426 [Botryobasidium botryosum FD-172 SS1]
MSSGKFVLKWGIFGTGNMATQFAKDLVLPPGDRGEHEIVHRIGAVASSRGINRAASFAQNLQKADEAEITPYGSYTELLDDANVDIVYLGIPTSEHYENMISCLEAGKHVLCEKAFTINARQTEHIFALARSKGLFVAEARWTLYFPIIKEIRHVLHTKRALGKIHRVTSDLSLDFAAKMPHHSIRNATLGGGALLAVGIYPLTWAMLALYEDPENTSKEFPEVEVGMLMAKAQYDGDETVSDEQTNVSLTFRELRATAVLTSSLTMRTPKGCTVLIQGEKGSLTIPWASYCPSSYDLTIYSTGATTEHKFDIPGKGLFYQADVCARSIRDRKLEPEECTHEATLVMMRLMDQVREKGKFRYPGKLEDVLDY